MKREFKTALEKRRIISFPEGRDLVSHEVDAAEEDVGEARDRHRNAMILREEADYHGEFSASGAKSVLNSAERFLEAVKQLLGRKR
jgi:uncharacterized protein (UPF0332 family)